MPKVENRDELIEWATDRRNVDEFLQYVIGILHSKPDKYVSIEEIAKRQKWHFEGYAEDIGHLCIPLILVPGIDFEAREGKNYALWVLKYSPDTEKEFKKTADEKFPSREKSFREEYEEDYAETIGETIDHFKGVKRGKKLKSLDKIRDEAEGVVYKAEQEKRMIDRDY